MNFLKKNLFLVITVAVVVVCVSVSLLAINSWGSQAGDGGKPYISTSEKINSLASGGVNEKCVEEAKRRDEGMQLQKETVEDVFLQRNRQGYEVLSFEILDRTVPAFPVDPKDKDRETLRQLFPEKYRREVINLLETLKPTVPPTDKEIDDEITRVSASAMPEDRKEKNKPTGPGPALTGMGEREHGERFGPETERRREGPKTGAGDVKNEIERQALNNLVVRKSEEGWIYADKGQDQKGDGRSVTDGAMDMALTRGTTDYSDGDLWMAQVGLWVQKDIINAIILTNSQVTSGNRMCVEASAVKRLLNIGVRGFVLRGTGTAGATDSTLQYLNPNSSRGDKSVPQLTGRACNKLYDVVHYDFTVIISMRHLLMLQKNLMEQNYHTILEISIIKPVQSKLHYYGTESVMKVTIVGEMLMLTDWTRGRWDKEAKAWDKDCPPLMPAEKFLKNIWEVDPSALRDEDNKREGWSPAIETKTKTKSRGGRSSLGGRS